MSYSFPTYLLLLAPVLKNPRFKKILKKNYFSFKKSIEGLECALIFPGALFCFVSFCFNKLYAPYWLILKFFSVSS